MNVLLISLGSAGDVLPFVRLGQALQGRGHCATIVTNPYFKAVVQNAGLGFEALSTLDDYHTLTSHPDLWHPRKGGHFLAQHITPLTVRPVYEIISRFDPAETIVVAGFLALGARLAQERLGIPLVTVYLQPAVMYSAHQMPKISSLPLPDWLPSPLKRLVLKGIHDFYDQMYLAEVNALRTEIGLPAQESSLYPWLHSPQRGLGLFPAWFASPQPDWPSQTSLTSFVLYDDGQGLPAEVEAFLDAGDVPILFTAGTAMRHGRHFFAASAEACRLLGRRGLMLTRYPEQLPEQLPAGVRHFDYIPLSAILPRVAALVHHGGIGTLAQGLAAGTPQLVMPMAHDQPDNAARLARLGAGMSIPPGRYRGPLIARKLTCLLESPVVRANCQALARRFDNQRTLEETCRLVEETAKCMQEEIL